MAEAVVEPEHSFQLSQKQSRTNVLLGSLAVVSLLLGESVYRVLSTGFHILPTLGYEPVGEIVFQMMAVAGGLAFMHMLSYPATLGHAWRIVVNDGYLRWFFLKTSHDTPWSGITGLRIVARGEEPILVKLKTSDRQTIRLAGFEDMNAITSLLRERVPEDIPVRTKRTWIPIDKPAFVGAFNLLYLGVLWTGLRTCMSLLLPYVKTPPAAMLPFLAFLNLAIVCLGIAWLVRPGMAFDPWNRMRRLAPGLPERNYLAWLCIMLGGMWFVSRILMWLLLTL